MRCHYIEVVTNVAFETDESVLFVEVSSLQSFSD